MVGHTLEEAYREALKAIPFPMGHPQREAARKELREQLEAGLFERDGKDLTAIRRPQQAFAVSYFKLVASFYNGEIDDLIYRQGRIELLRAYAQRLFELGLLTMVFDDGWVRDFARDSLQWERKLLPVKATGFTEDDGWLLCNPLRQFSQRFFKAVHEEFGRGRLRINPEIYVGVEPQVRER